VSASWRQPLDSATEGENGQGGLPWRANSRGGRPAPTWPTAVRLAKERGIHGFNASVLPANLPMRRVFEKVTRDLASFTTTTFRRRVIELWFPLRRQGGPARQAASR